jgi:alkylation response protein AidB-like acyl-CoA dehydrogenase
MNLEWSQKDLAFRDEVRAFLAAELTEELRAAGSLMTSVYADTDLAMKWQQILLKRGWAAPAWPVEHGGCDWSATQHYLFARELALASAPPLSPMGIYMCAPAIMAFGTDLQKQFFLPRMLNGEHLWCQGYSEPESGSDLASLKMPAIVDGDHLVCNGSKIWTTHADRANWIFCLVRTSRAAKPQAGITFLLIDMKTPGIEVRPIVSLSGEHIQNQIFFTDVRVPKANVLGTIDQGWTVAKYLLEFERGGTAYAPRLQARLAQIRRFARQQAGSMNGSFLEDPLYAAKLSDTAIRIDALEIYELQVLAALQAGRSPGTAASLMKIQGTELQQKVTELALEASAYYGQAYQPRATIPGGAVSYPHATDGLCGPIDAALAPLRYLNERAGAIYAGSNEIQRNILAKAALGL